VTLPVGQVGAIKPSAESPHKFVIPTPLFPSFPRKRESIADTVKVDPRLRGDDERWMAIAMYASPLPSFPRKRESIVDTV
jgi:hypothetical protein